LRVIDDPSVIPENVDRYVVKVVAVTCYDIVGDGILCPGRTDTPGPRYPGSIVLDCVVRDNETLAVVAIGILLLHDAPTPVPPYLILGNAEVLYLVLGNAKVLSPLHPKAVTVA
jgi:hypothetical protein